MWNQRPADAPPTWAADALGKHLMDIEVAVQLDDGSTYQGRLDDVAKDRSAVVIDPGQEVPVPSERITAYAIVPETIDTFDELRGDTDQPRRASA